MAQMRAIRSRKKAAQTIGKITRAMAVVANVKLQKLRKRMLAAAPYAQKLREMVAVLTSRIEDTQHPLLRPPSVKSATGRIALLIITSNRGLVGAHNSNVLRMASNFIRHREAENIAVEVHVTGRKGTSYFASQGHPLMQRHAPAGDMPSLADVEDLAARFVDSFTSGRLDAVHVAYTNFISAGVQRAELLTLLPMATTIRPAVETAGTVMYDFSPNPSRLLDGLLPLMLRAGLFECVLSAATSEHAARRLATMRATENADQMAEPLTSRYNRARQDHITNELMIIVGAAEAIRNSAHT